MRRLSIFAPRLRVMTRSRALSAGILLLLLKTVAFGDTFTFDTDPLAGTIVRTAPGRQLVGGELFINFKPAQDTFDFAPIIFGGDTKVNLASGPVNALPSKANVVVLQTLDNDNDPLSPFGAFQAADLIAGKITHHGPGVFIFFNQSLAIPELVYSDDLASNLADLRTLARMINLNGQIGIDSLSGFSAADFAVSSPTSTVPEPSSINLAAGAIVLAIAIARKRKQTRLRRTELTTKERFA